MLNFLHQAWNICEDYYFIVVFVVGGIYLASKLIRTKDEWGP